MTEQKELTKEIFDKITTDSLLLVAIENLPEILFYTPKEKEIEEKKRNDYYIALIKNIKKKKYQSPNPSQLFGNFYQINIIF